ncbi:hypothetical protein SPBR_09147 [Sporothrix brasiliensis 5110]|uniref:Uncharacterized protein n=1 Tax=Sporothrix brasiliensis 5110 TaxID=1398154 RepID=A0A0C2J7R0_9PEZI|nr:uncharacterized protein SPBR_09147 [Sporothrix brasiliensis 5110]KIH93057.1 hypothetical protein SPBR_09147 [Sporothrix brasiliensis 5110]
MDIDSPMEDGAQSQQGQHAPSSPSRQGFAATEATNQQGAQSAQDQSSNQSGANHLSFRSARRRLLAMASRSWSSLQVLGVEPASA